MIRPHVSFFVAALPGFQKLQVNEHVCTRRGRWDGFIQGGVPNKQRAHFPCHARRCRTFWLVVCCRSDISVLFSFAGRSLATFKGVRTAGLFDGVRCDPRPEKRTGNHSLTSRASSYRRLPVLGVALLGWVVCHGHIDHFYVTTGRRRLAPSAKSQDLSNLRDEDSLNQR